MTEHLILELLRDLKSGQSRIELELHDLNIRLAILEAELKSQETPGKDSPASTGGPVVARARSGRK